MWKHFKESIILTILGIILAYYWGAFHLGQNGLLAVFIVLFLGILEVTLSFDNAVINAMKLEHMSEKWQHRFLTWGILIAVFGMRLLFPIWIVSIFSGLNIIETSKLALQDIQQYSHYLHQAHIPLVTFGGAFLIMLFLHYFIEENKEILWLKLPEKILSSISKIKFSPMLITLGIILTLKYFTPIPHQIAVLHAGIWGIVIFLAINKLSATLEAISQKKQNITGEVAKQGFIGFLYLELIDASFSLDGVLGAFAISKDIIIITIGLSIGAMFVRSLTLFMVEKKTLKQYKYLENGAHWAIGLLAIIMFISVLKEIPEVITGLTGLLIVGSSFIASIIDNKTLQKND